MRQEITRKPNKNVFRKMYSSLLVNTLVEAKFNYTNVII